MTTNQKQLTKHKQILQNLLLLIIFMNKKKRQREH